MNHITEKSLVPLGEITEIVDVFHRELEDLTRRRLPKVKLGLEKTNNLGELQLIKEPTVITGLRVFYYHPREPVCIWEHPIHLAKKNNCLCAVWLVNPKKL